MENQVPGGVVSHTDRLGGGMPRAVRSLLCFQVLNAVNFTIALGAPMVLVAKALGASTTLIGCLLSFTPFFVILQLFASNAAERKGYRAVIMAGWRSRAFLVLLLAPLPWLNGRAPALVLLAVLTLVLLGFNVFRGYSCVGWLPWISQVIPDNQRGRYFGLEQTVVNAGVLMTLWFCGWFVGHDPAGWKYSLLFVISWLAGWCSIQFLRNVPCAMPAGAAAKAGRSWRQLLDAYRGVWTQPNFRRITRFSALNALAVAAFPGFVLVFQKDALDVSEGAILVLASGATAGSMVSAVVWGRVADRFGSRPLLRLAGFGQILLLLAWAAAAAHLYKPGVVLIALLYVAYGVVQCATVIPNARLMLSLCPAEETTVASTLNSVLVAVCGGLAPLAWGGILDILGRWHTGGNGPLPFAVFFGVSCGLSVLAQLALNRVYEPTAAPAVTLIAKLFSDWPLRVVSDFITIGKR